MSITRRHVTSTDDLAALRAEAMRRLLAGDPTRAAALVRETRPSGELCTELAALRGEVRARAAVAAGDEAQAQIALTELVRAGHPSYSGWSTGAVMLSVAELRARARGPIAFFDHTGRRLLTGAREELKGVVWCNEPAAADWEDNAPLLPADDPLLDEARVSLSRSYSLMGRTAPTRQQDGWDVFGPDRWKATPGLPVKLPDALDAAREEFEAARAAAQTSHGRAGRSLRRSLQALVAACTPQWPADGGPWWSAPASGLIVDVAWPDGREGRHRLALADTVASWEDDDDTQVFWWPAEDAFEPATAVVVADLDSYVSSGLHKSLAYMREALVHAAGSGLHLTSVASRPK